MKPKKYLILKRATYRVISLFILLNSPYISSLTIADEYKSQINFENFEEVYFGNDSKFEDRDSPNYRLDSFFGLDYSHENKNFSDLAIPYISRDFRKIYEYKLKQMSIKENKKQKDFFFKGEL